MRSLSFLSKMILFSFLLSSLPVIFIGSFSYFTSSNEIQKNVNESKQQLIGQINTNVEHKLTTVNHTLNQVVNSTVMKSALTGPLTATDFRTYDNLRNEIRYMQSFDTKLEDVILINERENWMIKNSGLYQLDQYQNYPSLLKLLNDVKEDTSWVLTPSEWFYGETNVRSVSCAYSISLVKKLPPTGLDKFGLAIANIPACSLQDFVTSMDGNTDEHSTDTLILDEQNRILFHPNQSLIGKQQEEAGLTKLELPGQSGQFTSHLNRKPYSITYLKSDVTGWTYLSVTSIDGLTKESNKIGLYTIYICIIMLLVSITLAWIGSKRMYSPIQVLLNQIGERFSDSRSRKTNEFQIIGEQVSRLFESKSELENEVRQHIGQVRTFFLIKLFQGKVKTSEYNENLEQFGYHEQLLNWKSMMVLTMQIDSIDDTRFEKRDLDLLLFAVHNIIEELVPAGSRLAPVTIDHTVVTVVGSRESDRAAAHHEVFSMTEHVQRQIFSFLNLQVSIGMSLPFDTITNVPIAYREGLEALKHRIKLGEGIIIQYENINSGKHYLNLNYPKQLENELLDAIKLAEQDKARELLKQLLHNVFAVELSPQEYQIPLARLLNNLLISMQESGISVHQIRPDKGPLFEEVFSLSIASEIEDWFWNKVVKPMVSIFSDRQEAQYHNISEKIIDLVHNYFDTDLTLEECANRLHYNANYLSSIFRKETNHSFSEYLSMYRFNMAKKWLAETDMAVKDIAEKLCYTNPQNFIRSFRKQEGMTPGQYRAKMTAGH
ncbi:AraC family transcriptional regulator [Paenibacillus sp. YYML68]|uniref:AraC family transcriptional regulator n=1 Tax=Paenibacillus sp. YYML68 TaxID=2909250 RepID=UPI00249334D9|nr:AraC family transcriptional regulator [Paenibacillus sp. YYML68]